MGERTSDTLKEIESIRSRLDAKLTELESRLPPLLRTGKRAAVALAGGGVGGSLLWMVVRRRLGRPKAAAKVTAPTQQINVLPRGAVPAAIAIAAVWAGVRLYESRSRSGRTLKAEVRSLGERRAG